MLSNQSGEPAKDGDMIVSSGENLEPTKRGSVKKQNKFNFNKASCRKKKIRYTYKKSPRPGPYTMTI